MVDETHRRDKEKSRKIHGVTWVLVIVLVVLVSALAIGLGAGLGVGLSQRRGSGASESDASSSLSSRPTSPSSTGTPEIPSNDLSTSGAFNGTGIALVTQSFGQDSYGTVVVFFQHWTGQIRWVHLGSGSETTWTGCVETNIVGTDARNGTPIAGVAYSMEGMSLLSIMSIKQLHIFYIEINNVLQETINGNTTNNWQVGPLGEFEFEAMDDPHAALQGFWEGYRPGGQINAVPIEGTGDTYTDSSQTRGINLWYGSDSVTLQSVQRTFATAIWTKGETLTGFNAHAGVGCYSWEPGTVTYLMASATFNTVNIMWKDLSQNTSGNSSHPVGEWKNSSIAVPDSFQNSSLGYTEFL